MYPDTVMTMVDVGTFVERNVPTNTMLRRNGHQGHFRGPAPRTHLQDHARQR
jgi:hypothetical protein